MLNGVTRQQQPKRDVEFFGRFQGHARSEQLVETSDVEHRTAAVPDVRADTDPSVVHADAIDAELVVVDAERDEAETLVELTREHVAVDAPECLVRLEHRRRRSNPVGRNGAVVVGEDDDRRFGRSEPDVSGDAEPHRVGAHVTHPSIFGKALDHVGRLRCRILLDENQLEVVVVRFEYGRDRVGQTRRSTA